MPADTVRRFCRPRRTDLPGGHHGKLIQSIRERLLPLPDTTLVIPGHGPETTIGEERVSNPFLL